MKIIIRLGNRILVIILAILSLIGSISLVHYFYSESSQCESRQQIGLELANKLLEYYFKNGAYPTSIENFGYDLSYIVYENRGRMSESYRNDSCNPTCIQDFELFVRCGFATYQYNYLSREFEQRSIYRWP